MNVCNCENPVGMPSPTHYASCPMFGLGAIAAAINEQLYADTGEADVVNHPPHYTSHPSGVECITVTEHMNFCRGNAVKYIWRAGEKGDEIEDLKKARWYIDREIERLTNLS